MLKTKNAPSVIFLFTVAGRVRVDFGPTIFVNLCSDYVEFLVESSSSSRVELESSSSRVELGIENSRKELDSTSSQNSSRAICA